MKALLAPIIAAIAAIAAAVFLFACSPGATPSPTPIPTPTLDPSIPIFAGGEAIKIVWAHLDGTWHAESRQTCMNVANDIADVRVYDTEYLGDRIWQVNGWDAYESEVLLVWKVREFASGGASVEDDPLGLSDFSGDYSDLGGTSGELVESPAVLVEAGCG